MGTHSAFGEGSHTAAYTAKQGAFLPRPQCGFALPAKFLLFTRAFIYIHFPVHCEPPLSAERKIRRNCRRNAVPNRFSSRFSTSRTNGPCSLSQTKASTLGSLRKIAHSGLHAETGGISDGGGITYPRTVPHVHQHPRAGYQNGVLCRFWILAGCALEERRKPSGQRCAYACRCSEGVAAPLGCVICLQLGDVAVFSLCAQYFLNVRGGGGITTLGAFHTFRKPCVAVA